MSIQLSCHCGAVAGELDEQPTSAMSCNCSICQRKGYLLHFSSPERFHLATPRDALTIYTFGQHVIRHQFCRHCGCAVFGEGTAPDGSAIVAVNLRCAEGIDLDALSVERFDGAAL